MQLNRKIYPKWLSSCAWRTWPIWMTTALRLRTRRARSKGLANLRFGVSKKQIGKITLGGIAGLISLGIATLIWQTQVSGQSAESVNQPTEVVPWVGETFGISRLNSVGELENRFPFNPDNGRKDPVNCTALAPWVDGPRYQRGEIVTHIGFAWRAKKRTRAEPAFLRRNFSSLPPYPFLGGLRGTKKWAFLGGCSTADNVQRTGIVGLVNADTKLYAYGHDHSLYAIDTDSDGINEITLPEIVDIGGVNCRRVEDWREGHRYKRGERVRFLDQRWKARKRTTREPGSNNGKDWRDQGACAQPIPLAGMARTQDDILWIARGVELLRLNLQSQQVQNYLVDAPITTITWDEPTQQLWLASGSILERRDHLGNLLSQHDLGNGLNGDITAIGIEPVRGLLWASAAEGRISQFDANGIFFGDFTVPLGTIEHILSTDIHGNLDYRRNASIFCG